MKIYQVKGHYVFLMTLVMFAAMVNIATGLPLPQSQPSQEPVEPFEIPDPKAGSPAFWEGRVKVNTHSIVNPNNGNLLTAVFLNRIEGLGPNMCLSLYHNSADGQWRGTYSAHLDLSEFGEDIITLISDVGRQIKFEKVGSIWIPERGCFFKLDTGPLGWRITLKDQTALDFDSYGFLITITDSTGHVLTINRNWSYGGRISSIIDVSGRTLTFDYDIASGLLESVEENFQIDDPDGIPIQRQWSFQYNNDDLIEMITFPKDASTTKHITIDQYDTEGRIESLTDLGGNTYTYHYNSDGRLHEVIDPAPYSNQKQSFSYDLTRTVYTNQRGAEYKYLYGQAANGIRWIERVVDPLRHGKRFTYNQDFCVTELRDALGNSWQATYDGQGNLLTFSDPEGAEPDVVCTYDGLNNITSATDALDNTVTFLYESSIDPTLPTSKIVPSDGYGNEEKAILFDYHGDEEPTAKGMLKTVTDLNGVKTHFYYDAYGQPLEAHEGLPDGVNPWHFVKMRWEFDAGSRLCVSETTGEHTTGDLDWIDSSCPDYGLPFSRIDDLQWNDMGRVVFMDASLEDDYIGEYQRIRIWQTFDELGRLTSHTKTSDEINDSGTEVTTGFTYSYDWVNGIYTRTNVATGELVQLETDLAGRIHKVQCGMPTPNMTADYTYYNNDLLHTVTYGSGAKVVYSYRTNGQISQIKHMRSDEVILKQLDYTYDDLNLVETLSESDDSGLLAVTVFMFDNRNKLRREIRYDAQYPYDMIYTYDQGGNRKTKTDYLNKIHTEYSYDVDDNPPPGCETRHNRLLSYVVKNVTNPTSPVNLMTVNYEYALEGSCAGNVTEIEKIVHVAPFTNYCTFLTYGRSGELWILTEFENDILTKITEFRGRGQRRYMVRDRDLVDYEPVYESARWTEYDRVTPVWDYSVDPDPASGGAITPVTNYVLGLGQQDASSGEVSYFHNDGLGTTRLLSDGNQAVNSRHIYTAFGEKIMESGSASTRYGYAGVCGYEDISEYINQQFAFDAVHVGHRYYSPAIGRFLQRDLIGIQGGLNVYEYLHSNPVDSTDPTGLFDFHEALGGLGRGMLYGRGGGPMAHITIPAFGLLSAVIAGWEDEDTQFVKDVVNGAIDAVGEATLQEAQRAVDEAEALADAIAAAARAHGEATLREAQGAVDEANALGDVLAAAAAAAGGALAETMANYNLKGHERQP